MTATRGNFTEGPPQVYSQGLWDESATKKHRLGTIRTLDDGRMFVYCQAGATALAAGKWVQSVITTLAEDTVTVAHAAGSKEVTVTEAGQAGGITLNQFEDGFLVVDAGAGIGEMYKIAHHAAIANAATGNFKLYDGLATAWVTTTTNIHAFTNPYKALVIGTAGTVRPACVPQRPVTANYYFWGQVRGWAAMIMDANGTSVGAELDEKILAPSVNHDGLAYGLAAPDANLTLESNGFKLGEFPLAADFTDNEANLVYLTIL